MKKLGRFPFFVVMALSVILVACSSKEPEERTAFIQFLQTRIIDKPGVHVPQLSEEDKKSLGDYAAHYAVITGFNEDMNSVTKPLENIMAGSMFRSLSDITSNHEKIKALRTALAETASAADTALAKADAARAKLQQPDDLKVVYDAAYDRVVTRPAQMFKQMQPKLDGMLGGVLDLADFVENNKSKIEISGAMIKVQDPAIQAELNKLIQQLEVHAREMQAIQKEFIGMMSGR